MTRPLLLSLAAALVVTSCNSKPAEDADLAPAASSNEALMRTLEALEKGEAENLRSLVAGGTKAQAFFDSAASSFAATDAFEQKFVASYGADAWTAFNAPLPLEEKRSDMRLVVPDLAQIRKDSAQWQADQANDGVFDGLPQIKLRFKQVAKGWVIDGPAVLPDEKSLIAATKLQNALADLITRYMKAVGHPGLKAEDIDYQMGKEFLGILMGVEFKSGDDPAIPDRFKLEEL